MKTVCVYIDFFKVVIHFSMMDLYGLFCINIVSSKNSKLTIVKEHLWHLHTEEVLEEIDTVGVVLTRHAVAGADI